MDTNSQDLLDDPQGKSLVDAKAISTTPAGPRTPSPQMYLRSASHILTTPPNPLASDDHPDNQLAIGNNFQKSFSPIPSAGFELTTTSSNNMKVPGSASNLSCERSFFNFDSTQVEHSHLKAGQHNDIDDDNHDKLTQTLLRNSDGRATKLSSNSLIQDDNSNQSSTNSSSHNPSTRMLSQMFSSSGESLTRTY